MNEVGAHEWLTAREVVEQYKLPSLAALYTMRSRGKGPKGHRFGRDLKFHLADLKAWEDECADQVAPRMVCGCGKREPSPTG
ncbi:hypothetical protein GCM10022254_09860 [Actinomadura meridiana]|uniref:Helix-turn-helix domain-containing protein n=1 Tax=Actinomadura meridiana TaxID=559626 RepID=A0ABP8BTS9_9ACTN